MMSLSSTPSKTPTWRSSMSRCRWETCDTETSNTSSTRSRSHMSDGGQRKRDSNREREIKTQMKHAKEGRGRLGRKNKVDRKNPKGREKPQGENRPTAGSIWLSEIWERGQSTKWRISFWLSVCLCTVCCTVTCPTFCWWLVSLLLCRHHLCTHTHTHLFKRTSV